MATDTLERPSDLAAWRDLESADPALAETARTLLTIPGVGGFGYLATVDGSGYPRIHPVMPVWAEGRMLLFVVPSPKLADLRRDGRYALHSTGSEDVDDELLIVGRAVVIEEERELRAAALAACSFEPGEDHVLVELGLERLMWGHYEPRGVFPPQYHVWRAGAS